MCDDATTIYTYIQMYVCVTNNQMQWYFNQLLFYSFLLHHLRDPDESHGDGINRKIRECKGVVKFNKLNPIHIHIESIELFVEKKTTRHLNHWLGFFVVVFWSLNEKKTIFHLLMRSVGVDLSISIDTVLPITNLINDLLIKLTNATINNSDQQYSVFHHLHSNRKLYTHTFNMLYIFSSVYSIFKHQF